MKFWKKKKTKKPKVKIPYRSWMILLFGCGVIWFYTNSLWGVDPETKAYYQELKTELKAQGYDCNLIAISGKRWAPDNWVLSTFGGASSSSKHLKGQAIDILVLDVNRDGIANSEDVDIVYNILNKSIIGSNGGIGTYKNETFRFSAQMIHFDSRGTRARWHK